MRRVGLYIHTNIAGVFRNKNYLEDCHARAF